jgi:carbonic anhydrase/acetyltransferase-like protein (isoleucine patch superfamily)
MTGANRSGLNPLILAFKNVEPRFAGEPHFLGDRASVLGKVEAGSNAVIAAGAVLRADGHFVRIGDDFSIGKMSTVHIAHDIFPAIIGHRTAVGRKAVVHACTVGDDCIIEDDAVILDGSVLGDNIVIEAGSTVFPKSKLAGGFVYAGMPAKPISVLTLGEHAARAARVRETAIAAQVPAARPAPIIDAAGDAFIAKTAQLSGRITMRAKSSVFFGCAFDARDSEIVIGENTNVQDNTVIDCAAGGVILGRDVTVGHNVKISACRVGDRALLGIGSTVSEGTIVEEGVMLAASAVTLPGQRLESGWLWGGRPARLLSRLDDSRHSMMAAIIAHYCAYASAYRRAQQEIA